MDGGGGGSSLPAGIDIYKLFIVCVLKCLLSLIFVLILKTFFYMCLCSIILAFCDAARSRKSVDISFQTKKKINK